MNKAVLIVLIVLALIGFLWANEATYQDELITQEIYCDGVKSGLHKDFKNIYDKACIEE